MNNDAQQLLHAQYVYRKKKRNLERRILRDYFNPFEEDPWEFKKYYRLFLFSVLN